MHMTLLYVEDDPIIRDAAVDLLAQHVSHVITAANGAEGLEKFKIYRPDVVLSDIAMPVMSGIAMSKAIKKIRSETPIILLSAHSDNTTLLEALALDISSFLLKPVTNRRLIEALEKCFKEISYTKLATELADKNHALNIALSHLASMNAEETDQYEQTARAHALEKENAFKKEIQILRDDLSQTTAHGLFFDSYYQPIDILSGDIYGMTALGDGVYFAYIVDAMGKGLAASVTSIQSSSFINHALDMGISNGNASFDKLLASFTQFIRKQLLPDEMICFMMLRFDLSAQTLEIANYGMPPLLLEHRDGSVVKIRSNNPPLMNFITSTVIDTRDFSDAVKLLALSDGIVENMTSDGAVYASRLPGDFAAAATARDMARLFESRCPDHGDDLTLLFFRRFVHPPVKTARYEIFSSLDQIEHLLHSVETLLAGWGMSRAADQLIYTLNELLVNALEHGSLGITFDTKQQLLSHDEYESYLLHKCADPSVFQKKIKLSVIQSEEKGKRLLCFEVEDEGDGFDSRSILKKLRFEKNTRFHGRGLAMIRKMVDGFYFSPKGNTVIFIKTFEEEA